MQGRPPTRGRAGGTCMGLTSGPSSRPASTRLSPVPVSGGFLMSSMSGQRACVILATAWIGCQHRTASRSLATARRNMPSRRLAAMAKIPSLTGHMGVTSPDTRPSRVRRGRPAMIWATRRSPIGSRNALSLPMSEPLLATTAMTFRLRPPTCAAAPQEPGIAMDSAPAGPERANIPSLSGVRRVIRTTRGISPRPIAERIRHAPATGLAARGSESVISFMRQACRPRAQRQRYISAIGCARIQIQYP
jgi:hypothetical protein